MINRRLFSAGLLAAPFAKPAFAQNAQSAGKDAPAHQPRLGRSPAEAASKKPTPTSSRDMMLSD